MKHYWLGAGLFLILGCGGKSDGHGDTGSGGNVNLGGKASFGGMLGDVAGTGATSAGGTGSMPDGGAPPGSGGSSQPNGGAVGAGGNAGTVVTGPPVATNQLDLLLMIDNSLSMMDKQQVLARSLQPMLERLTSPDCVDAQGAPTGEKTDPKGACSRGVPEFTPISDMHIGVITSSLGAHGSQTCADPSGDDRAQLYPLMRPSSFDPARTWNGSGFLSWDPGALSKPPGESSAAQLAATFQDLVAAAGQAGCGFEAQLEAWYRFLIDPNPPVRVPSVEDLTVTRPEFVPESENPILQQRAKFLRRDSLVAVLMLTDENDCSILDAGQAWFVGLQTLNGVLFRMPRSTSACDENPNSPCCMSCASTVSGPSGCPAARDDIGCRAGMSLNASSDPLNLRCFKQKQRFGFDFLYPTSRYIDGLTRSHVLAMDGTYAPNPLFPTGSKRTASMVFLGGIVGVPWQDVATPESWSGANLEIMSFQELAKAGRWPIILGDRGNESVPPSPPGDKLMFESTSDRTALFHYAPHPLLGDSAALASSAEIGRPNVINGHERGIPQNDDLQYACIFALAAPRANCVGPACDCTAEVTNSPLCDGTTQTHVKAYPSVRELEVLKGVGDITGNAVVGSICAKSLDEADPANYGYVPTLSALVRAMKPALQ